jgi:hypothetical protein
MSTHQWKLTDAEWTPPTVGPANFGVAGRILCRDGSLYLVFVAGRARRLNRFLGPAMVPASLHIVDAHSRSRDDWQVIGEGRLSAWLFAHNAHLIDKAFGPGVAAMLNTRKTLCPATPVDVRRGRIVRSQAFHDQRTMPLPLTP